MTEPRAWQNKVILRQLREDEVSETWGGTSLLVPDSAKERQTYRQWVVVDVGPDVTEQALLIPGIRAIITPRSGVNFEWDNQLYKTLYEWNIVAVFG